MRVVCSDQSKLWKRWCFRLFEKRLVMLHSVIGLIHFQALLKSLVASLAKGSWAEVWWISSQWCKLNGSFNSCFHIIDKILAASQFTRAHHVQIQQEEPSSASKPKIKGPLWQACKSVVGFVIWTVWWSHQTEASPKRDTWQYALIQQKRIKMARARVKHWVIKQDTQKVVGKMTVELQVHYF